MDPYPLTDAIPDWIEALFVIFVIVIPLGVATLGSRYGEWDDD